MSNTTSTLDFMPTSARSGRPQGVFSVLSAFWESVRVGLAASSLYESLTARGTPPQKAVDIVYRTHFAKIG
jgi:hypothetical protein